MSTIDDLNQLIYLFDTVVTNNMTIFFTNKAMHEIFHVTILAIAYYVFVNR